MFGCSLSTYHTKKLAVSDAGASQAKRKPLLLRLQRQNLMDYKCDLMNVFDLTSNDDVVPQPACNEPQNLALVTAMNERFNSEPNLDYGSSLDESVVLIVYAENTQILRLPGFRVDKGFEKVLFGLCLKLGASGKALNYNFVKRVFPKPPLRIVVSCFEINRANLCHPLCNKCLVASLLDLLQDSTREERMQALEYFKLQAERDVFFFLVSAMSKHKNEDIVPKDVQPKVHQTWSRRTGISFPESTFTFVFIKGACFFVEWILQNRPFTLEQFLVELPVECSAVKSAVVLKNRQRIFLQDDIQFAFSFDSVGLL